MNRKRKRKQARRRPIIPAAPRYCPRCKRAVELAHPADPMYVCRTCETFLFHHETDTFPGQTHPPTVAVILNITENQCPNPSTSSAGKS